MFLLTLNELLQYILLINDDNYLKALACINSNVWQSN